MSDDGFLARWSQRKVKVKAGVPVPPEAGRVAPDAPPATTAPATPVAAAAPVEPAPAPADPPPTMDDVLQLAPGADVRRFLAPQVDEGVKRAALKKLFTDPHFNVMDGLDIYIEDYGKPDPLPESMLRQMAQAQFLGLFSSDRPEVSKDDEKPKASPDGAALPAMPQSSPDTPAVPPDEDPDLRLQQDDAAGRGGTGEGPPA